MSQPQQPLRNKALGTLAFAAAFVAAYWLLKVPTIMSVNHQKLRTQTNATALLQAIEGFHSEYEAQPKVALKGTDLITEGQDGIGLLIMLLGKEEVSNAMENKKQIRFLDVKETRKKEKGGLLYSKSTDTLPEGLYDAWGHPFHVRFPSGENGEIPDPSTPGKMIDYKIAIVYSYGKDGKAGGGDDIVTK